MVGQEPGTRGTRDAIRRVVQRGVMALAIVLLLASGPTARAEMDATPNNNARGHTEPVVDALFLRPLGFIATIAGTAIFIAGLPIFAITRPTQISEPFKALVVAPARYTWVDPLGDHAPGGD